MPEVEVGGHVTINCSGPGGLNTRLHYTQPRKESEDLGTTVVVPPARSLVTQSSQTAPRVISLHTVLSELSGVLLSRLKVSLTVSTRACWRVIALV